MAFANYLAQQGNIAPILEALKAKQLGNQQTQQDMQSQELAAKILPLLFRSAGGAPGGPAAPGMAPIGQPPGGPGGAPPPGGMPAPPGGAPSFSPIPGAAAGGGAPGGMPGMPPGIDMGQLMALLSQGGAPGGVQFGAAKDILGMVNPYEKQLTQLMLQNMRGDTSRRNTDVRTDTQREIAEGNQGVRVSEGAANRSSREGVQGSTRDATAVEKELSDQKGLLVGLLNNGKGPGNPEYDEAKKEFTSLKGELEGLRRQAPAGDKAAGKPAGKAKYTIGQIIPVNGKDYKVTGLTDPNNPDVEPVKK